MRLRHPRLSSRLHPISTASSRLFVRGWRRRTLCLVLIFGLLIVPDACYVVSTASSLAVQVAKDTVAPVQDTFRWVKRLLRRSPKSPRRETLADRKTHVFRIQITPLKLVGYQGQAVSFTALPLNFNGETIQGVRFDWESSDKEKVQIDDSGRVTFLQPGLARITCRAGSISASAPVLVRPGSHPLQGDVEWRLDQNALSLNGTTMTGMNDSGISGIIGGLLDKLTPTVQAQGGASYTNNDFLYDELWSEPRNLTGSPHNRITDSARAATVLPESNNFQIAIPLISLGGRGLAARLTLNYNSRVWFRHGNAVTFDAIESRPSPGFSLGFGRLVTYGSTNAVRYLWVSNDGTRHYLGQGGNASQTVTLQTNDGMHITYVGNAVTGGVLYGNDGTKMDINIVNNRLLPSRITDSNGNFITIAYKSFTCDPNCDQCACPVYFPALMLDYITDTMGRIIQCNYDANNNLTSIIAPGLGGTAQQPMTRTIAQFDYESRSIGSNLFSGLTVENRPTQAMNYIKHVYMPTTQTGYLFNYSAFGMAYSVSMRRQMSINGSGVISDGVESSSLAFNYQTGSTPALTDAPAFTQRTESATNAPTATYTYANSSDTLAQEKTYTITRPDNSTVNLIRSTNTLSVANGLQVRGEIKNNGGTIMAKSVIAYANDPGGQPQVQSIISYDDATPTPNQTKVDYDYDAYGNVANTREYGFQVNGQWQVRRRTRNVYKTDASYVNVYLRSLVIETNIYDALLNTNDADDVMLAKTTYTYDNYAAMSGMEEHRDAQGNLPPPPPSHLGSYDVNYTVRGNITGTNKWHDITGNQSYTWLRKIDVFGNTVKEQLSCCDERSVMLTETYCWAIAEQTTKGAAGGVQLTRSLTPDFNTNVTKDTTDPNNLQTSYGYDAALRQTDVMAPTLASSSASYNDATLSASHSVSYDDNGTTKNVTTTTDYDGWGRVIHQTNIHGGQVNTTYDAMGRAASVSNPFTAGGSPSYSTSYSYDVLGRTTVTTLPDNQIIQTGYNGNIATMTDTVNRKMQQITDGLGQLATVSEQDVSGNLTQATSYTYDALSNRTQVNQGGQLRDYKYDALSRLVYENIPEQIATINDGSGTFWTCKYTYTDSNAVATRQDARGVITTNNYDSLHRLTSINYNTVAGVTTAPPVTYTYDADPTYGTTAQGMVVRINVGSDYQERYTFDQYKRISSTIRSISSRSYTTGYQYNQAGQPLQVGHMNYQYDSTGRLSATGGISNITYNTAGQVTGDRLMVSGVNGSVPVTSTTDETFGYDVARMQLTSQTATTTNANAATCFPVSCPPPPAGGTNLSLTYTYNAATTGKFGVGTTTGNAGQLLSVSGSIGSVSESADYTYDSVGRLVNANQTSNGQTTNRRFAYDRWGNRMSVHQSLTQIQSVSIGQSGGVPTNRIMSVNNSGTTVSYTYDAAGNVANDGVHTYAYDSENRLVSVDGGTTTSHAYDQQNRRYKKTVGSTVTHYVWEGSQVLGEYNGSSGALQVGYWYVGGRLYKKTGATTQAFLSSIFSMRLTLSAIGAVVGRQSHLPFGEDFAESGTQQKQHFTSYERDSETATDYAVNRQYNQSVGRFMRPDPESKSCDFKRPQSLNRYVYVMNDPINAFDPLGLDDVTNPNHFYHPNPGTPFLYVTFQPVEPVWVYGGDPDTQAILGAITTGGVIKKGWISEAKWELMRPDLSPGRVTFDDKCSRVMFVNSESQETDPHKAWQDGKKLGGNSGNVDFIATPRGVVKIPDSCNCSVSCSSGENYRVCCNCGRMESLDLDDPKTWKKVPDPRKADNDWVGKGTPPYGKPEPYFAGGVGTYCLN